MPSTHHLGLSMHSFDAAVMWPAHAAGHTTCCITFSANFCQRASYFALESAASANTGAAAEDYDVAD